MKLNDLAGVRMGSGIRSQSMYLGDRLVHLGDRGGSWTPEDLTIAGWYKEDNITASGNKVTDWNGLNQSKVDKQPSYTSHNGLPCVQFDGDDTGSNGDILSGTSPYAKSTAYNLTEQFVACAFQNLVEPDIATYPDYGRGSLWGHINPWMNQHAPWSDGRIFYDVGHPSNGNRVFSPGSGSWMQDFDGNPRNTQRSIVTNTWNQATGDQKIFKNGKLIASKTGSTYAIQIETNASLRLGRSGFSQAVVIYEFILMDNIPTREEQYKIEGYLAHKWGYPEELDPQHPYKDVAP